MRKNLILTLTLVLPVNSFAGIETVLIEEQMGSCTVRVTHDATPDSAAATIIFRPFIVKDGLHYPCEVSKSAVTESLGKGIAVYLSNHNLKPATSIFIGRISRFTWVKSAWQAKAKSGYYEKMSNKEFNTFVISKDITQPFVSALNRNGVGLDGASCEKMQFHDNGYPMDALCWFNIKRR